MSSLAHQRCYNHAVREAAARCPSCRHFYCRECVSEHQHRLLCAKCIQQLLGEQGTGKRPLLAPLAHAAKLAVAVVLLWMLFLVYGQFMLLLPSEFHDSPGHPQMELEE
jgi:hypothetical protein